MKQSTNISCLQDENVISSAEVLASTMLIFSCLFDKENNLACKIWLSIVYKIFSLTYAFIIGKNVCCNTDKYLLRLCFRHISLLLQLHL